MVCLLTKVQHISESTKENNEKQRINRIWASGSPHVGGQPPPGRCTRAAAQQGGQVKGFVINLNGDLPTGVAQMDGEKLNADDAAIFNLSGQRMSKPQKGVNIVNGKKVLVK